MTDVYLALLPLTQEERRAAETPFWQRSSVPDVYRDEVNGAIERRCHKRPVDHPERRAGLAVGVLAAGGFLLYWLLPYLSILRHGLKPEKPLGTSTRPDGTPLPSLDAAIRALAADANVRPPAVLVHAVDTTVNAVAFGHWGRRYIEVSGGLEDRLRTDPGGFDALVRHELGHIRNRDLDVTQGVTALWWAFVTLVAGAFCLSLTGYAGEGTSLRELCLRLALLTGVVYAARNSYLQSRELHADKFSAACPSAACPSASYPSAAARPGSGETARQALDALFDESAKSRPGRGGQTGLWPFATHPSLARRRAALVRPALADELTGWEVALIGCLLAFAVNLILGHSFELMMFGLRTGILKLDDVTTLRPTFAWTALPFLLGAGPLVALGVRYSVLAWGGLGAIGLRLAARLAGLAACFWAGLCLGCLIYPGPITERAGTPTVLLWQSLTGTAALGLALTSTATVALCALLALGCEAVRLPRGPAMFVTGAYGALLAVTGFPTALAAGLAPYLRGVAVSLPLAGALCLVVRRPAQAGPRRALGAGYGTGTVTPAASPMRLRLRLLCHLTTLGMTAWALSTAIRLLTDFAPRSPLTLVSQLGLMLFVFGTGGAALAPHDTVFRRRTQAAAACLGAAALLSAVELFADGRITPWLLLILMGPAAGVVIASENSAAVLYDLRHGNGRRGTDPRSP
ncbi:M48 family metalloprotease [Streptomyces sp. ISL-86]|uniref:M48 family metalloprotease n=1 Tax=Streptomyces sp. ISL-86 TaxID=2819187 RepID=UPI001BE8156F|nr:M48 family metalloprotease [Streptomyces sp. ISL-86]MBT2458082.1 M48 family metalloprotease [Streptomyces sp. ISL-86]